jgi:RHS repeat-associated protein
MVQHLTFHFDGAGNVTSRLDRIQNLHETFQYDGFNRLIRWVLQGQFGRALSEYRYDSLSNLRWVLRLDGTIDKFAPDSLSAGPHAAVHASYGAYGYDRKGDQTSGPGREIAYTAFDLPRQVTTARCSWTFAYDGELTRVSKESSNGERILTIGGLYERRNGPSGVEHRFNIPLPALCVAQVVASGSAGLAAGETFYLHADHLGSIVAITDKAAQVVDRVAYSPFGERFNPASPGSPPLTGPGASGVDYGFNGHQHDDAFELINMRGRMYDPRLSRFLTPDPIVKNLLRAANLNPYSYALNNPLTVRDVSGFEDPAEVTEPVVTEEPHGRYWSLVRAEPRGVPDNVPNVTDNGIDPVRLVCLPPPNSTTVTRAPTYRSSRPSGIATTGQGSDTTRWGRVRHSIREGLYTFEEQYWDVPAWKWGLGAAGITAAVLLPFVSGLGSAGATAVAEVRLLWYRLGYRAGIGRWVGSGPIIVRQFRETTIEWFERMSHYLNHFTHEKWSSSLFYDHVNFQELIEAAQPVAPTLLQSGNWLRVVVFSRPVGIDASIMRPTNVYSVITDSLGRLITMFPGFVNEAFQWR